MAINLPILSTGAFSYEISLDGTIYDLRIWWAGDRGGPRLDLGLRGQAWIVQGVKMIRFWPLLYRVRDTRRPPGDLYLIERTSNLSSLQPITRDSLKSGVQILTYLTRAEILAIQPPANSADDVRFVGVP